MVNLSPAFLLKPFGASTVLLGVTITSAGRSLHLQVCSMVAG